MPSQEPIDVEFTVLSDPRPSAPMSYMDQQLAEMMELPLLGRVLYVALYALGAGLWAWGTLAASHWFFQGVLGW